MLFLFRKFQKTGESILVTIKLDCKILVASNSFNNFSLLVSTSNLKRGFKTMSLKSSISTGYFKLILFQNKKFTTPVN
jgi:hypothetical protein